MTVLKAVVRLVIVKIIVKLMMIAILDAPLKFVIKPMIPHTIVQ